MDGSAFKVHSLAKRWDCSEKHIRKMLADGQLKGFKLGGRLWRISAEEVARIERGEEGKAEAAIRREPANENVDDALFRARLVARYKNDEEAK